MTITFRDAGAEDAEAIDQLFRRSFCDTFAHLYAPEDLRAFLARFTREAWIVELTDERFAFRLAMANDQLIGFAKLGPSELPVETVASAIELRQLYLLHEWRGSGAATELMDWAITEARHMRAEEMYLTVYTDNDRALRFYERYGFERIGPYRFMVGNHVDEDIIMRRAL